jgi:hypothetical protein
MAVLLAACSGPGGSGAAVISTAGTIGVGEQRILVELRGPDGEPIATDVVPTATLRDENGSPLGEYPGDLVWVVPDEHPIYSFSMEIPAPETYQLTVDMGEAGETGPAGFEAVADPAQPQRGDTAPLLDGADPPHGALLVFASPDWCPSESCQPMIDQLEAAAAQDSGLDWMLVDVFANPDAASQDDLVISPNIETWGLPSQPWLYAIDGSGVVAAAYEGAVSAAELTQAIAAIEG